MNDYPDEASAISPNEQAANIQHLPASTAHYPESYPFDADGALCREFLLERGYCCGNGCRNCPYDDEDEGLLERLVEGIRCLTASHVAVAIEARAAISIGQDIMRVGGLDVLVVWRTVRYVAEVGGAGVLQCPATCDDY